MAEKEAARQKDLLFTLDYISQQLDQLAVLSVLPEDVIHRESIINRALDVHTASVLFLAVSIRHESTWGGIPGIISLKYYIIYE